MKYFHFILALLLILGLAAATPHRPSLAAGVYFDDTGPEFMRLGNSFYEVAFRKDNGGIVYITDKAAGGQLSQGSLNGCLWVVVFDYNTQNEYIESCRFRPNNPYRFSYSWSAVTRQLTMRYDPDPAAAKSVAAVVTVTASASNWFDLHMSLENRWGYVPVHVKFPSDLVFTKGSVQEALLPYLPGVVLESSFLQLGKAAEAEYPGILADFVALKSVAGRFAMYSISPNNQVVPVRLGFSGCEHTNTCVLLHNFASGVRHGAVWSSPLVRIRVAEDYPGSIQALRTDNRVDEYPSVEDKLGTLADQIVRLPLYKADLRPLRFADYAAYLSPIPYPGILHPVAYWPRGFDENYPDFFPPDPALGTLEEMAAMFRQVRSMGYLVMPYINPTWWDDESPTMQNLPPPLTARDIAVLNKEGEPFYEPYDIHWGYVVSPYHPFVQQRLDRLMHDMKEAIPSDLIHEDQVGGRTSYPDYNPASPSTTSYSQGWFEHTQRYHNMLLTCEYGFDRLAATETGFHGSVLLDMRSGRTNAQWGDENWYMYPLAPILLRDKVLLYHNTEGRSSTTEKWVLSLNLAFGYMLGYDVGHLSIASPWLTVTGAFQSHVVSRYATERMLDYQQLQSDVTRSRFEHTTVMMNWSKTSSYASGGYVLPPEGVLVQRDDNSLTAGIFTAYNSSALSPGDHYLIEERGASEIIVRQPMGDDTPLTVRPLSPWASETAIDVWAFDRNDRPIGRVSATASAAAVTFTYRHSLAGQPVAYYRLAPAQSTPTPTMSPTPTQLPTRTPTPTAVALPRFRLYLPVLVR